MEAPINIQIIADAHQQVRNHTCFQMGPELALKFAGVLDISDYPYQNKPQWDGRGFEPFVERFENLEWTVDWIVSRFDCPYAGMVSLFHSELQDERYPIVSLCPPNQLTWHAYVVTAPIGTDDFLLTTKKGSVESQSCETEFDKLSSRTKNQLKVDVMTWRATRKTS